ncbi:MAG TPA: signal peptidase I [Nitrosopumilaceae archaeon]|nr:signal peptidase I [Nitrosopumilaceae archaeon]
MKKRSGISAIAKDIIIVVVGVAVIWIGLRVAFGTDNPFYVVSSGSMEPYLNVFDVLVVQGNEPFENIKKGDIIVFDRPSGHDRVIVHRVNEVLNDEPRILRTKGDANPASIPGTDFPITEQEYIGKVVYIVPQIGYVTRILTPPINYIIIAVIVGIMIIKQFGKSRSKPEPVVFSDTSPPNDYTTSSSVTSSETNRVADSEYVKTDSNIEDLNSKPDQKDN